MNGHGSRGWASVPPKLAALGATGDSITDDTEAIRIFTQQDPAAVFVEANALIVRLQEENRQLRADLAQAKRASVCTVPHGQQPTSPERTGRRP